MSSRSYQDIVRNITSITADSRKVTPNSLYIAIRGTQSDGHDFIADAIQSGAQKIIHDTAYNVPVAIAEKAEFIALENPRQALAFCAAAFYRGQPENIVAVTGTNGKSSVASFTQQFWQQNNLNAASLGTLGIHSSLYKQAGSLTTPDPVGLHQILQNLKERDITHLSMEASSHGLDQYRLDAVRLCGAGFTNLTRDHMDYHKTEAAYFTAKKRLFGDLLPAGARAVINVDNQAGQDLVSLCQSRKHEIIRYGSAGHELALHQLTPLAHGLAVDLSIFGQKENIILPLVGAFQAFNVMCAFGLSGLNFTQIDWAAIKGVDGRMERVGLIAEKQAAVYIDYAHTPDALETILKSFRPHLSGTSKLHLVFGCGGNRDTGKRPQMGKIAAELADHIIITDDNPRFESADDIRAQIMTACPDATNIGDRAKAIETALNNLGQGDILVVAGKGHESGQTIGNQTIPFNDKSVVQTLLGALYPDNQSSENSIFLRGENA